MRREDRRGRLKHMRSGFPFVPVELQSRFTRFEFDHPVGNPFWDGSSRRSSTAARPLARADGDDMTKNLRYAVGVGAMLAVISVVVAAQAPSITRTVLQRGDVSWAGH